MSNTNHTTDMIAQEVAEQNAAGLCKTPEELNAIRQEEFENGWKAAVKEVQAGLLQHEGCYSAQQVADNTGKAVNTQIERIEQVLNEDLKGVFRLPSNAPILMTKIKKALGYDD